MNDESGRHVNVHQTCNAKGKPLFIKNDISTTKYNPISFFPKNLIEQFSRIANFYFLIIASILYLFKEWAPLNGASAIIPLVMVLTISAVREGVEDFLRFLSDRDINHTKSLVLRSGSFTEINWSEILVGDVIMIKKNESIPADIVMISTSEPDGVAYIDTCNLDGETNLKVKQALPSTAHVVNAESASSFSQEIVCDEPNNMLYSFNGYFNDNGKLIPLDNKQVLLRGCVLRNTGHVIGVVVYTGLETKLMMNSSASRSKHSSLEKGLNNKLISVFAFMVTLAGIASAVGSKFEINNIKTKKAWYFFGGVKRSDSSTMLVIFLSYIILINAMIPISLYVTLEVVRVFQALFVHWDAEMYHQETNTSANSRTSNLSEDLGNIEYIFSDKTGTLTRNIMEFMKCSIGGRKFGSGTTEVAYAASKRRGIPCEKPDQVGKAFKDESFMEIIRNQGPLSHHEELTEVQHFLWMLATCHAVIPEEDAKKPYGIAFQASSPDEGALVSAAADFGYIFKQRRPGSIVINFKGNDVEVDLLAVLEFTSDRKRSSVIIRHPETNQIILYCKGADDLIMKRLSPNSKNVEITQQHLKDFAADGLRTLCAAYKVIDEDYFNQWIFRFNEANCVLEGREQAVDAIANEIECDLELLGATAIEDKLQIGVPEAIESLLEAGIRVWVITGDKRETAINIGFACSLLTSEMKLIIVDSSDPHEVMEQINIGNHTEGNIALVASGTALYHALREENQDDFFKLTTRCQSVICCRVSPLQKANVVKMVREKTGNITLAIGDGANDVGMILQADIGVGISGQEGRQACLAADYSFAQFRYLKRLLLVHGRLNLMRNVELINYSFYKNMVYTFTQFLFGIHCSFSALTLFDSFLYSIFNVIFTSAPPVVFAGIEQDISLNKCMSDPKLYKWDDNRKWMVSYANFWVSLIIGLVHSLIAFYVPYYGMRPFINGSGITLGYANFGITVYGCVVFIVTFRIASMSTYWTWMHHFFIWCSAIIYPICVIVIDSLGLAHEIRGLAKPTFSSSSFYFSLIGSTVIATIPIVAITTIQTSLNTFTNQVRFQERTGKVIRKSEIVQRYDSIMEVPQLPEEKYPDDDNPTGYAFEPPVATFNTIRYDTVQTQVFTADQIRSRIHSARKVSTFGLDELA